MSEISKAYEPQAVEDKWYKFWQENSCFTAPLQALADSMEYSLMKKPFRSR